MRHPLIFSFVFLTLAPLSLNAKEHYSSLEMFSPAIPKSTLTDRKNIELRVKKELLKWNEKGEFEKQDSVEPRLRTQSAIMFNAVCQKAFEELAIEKEKHWTRAISRYDAEGESFNITFRLSGIVKVAKLKVDMDYAQQIKENFNFLDMKVDQWCFVNGKLYPKSVSFLMDILGIGSKSYSVDLPFADSDQPVVAFDNLGVVNPYLKGKTFNYNAAVKEAQTARSGELIENKVFSMVDQMPSFPGGDAALMYWLRTHLIYPPVAEEGNIQGRVVVSLIVETDGRVTDVKVARSANPLLDQEAIRLAKSMPHWVPGKYKGVPVRVKYNIPVNFRIVQ